MFHSGLTWWARALFSTLGFKFRLLKILISQLGQESGALCILDLSEVKMIPLGHRGSFQVLVETRGLTSTSSNLQIIIKHFTKLVALKNTIKSYFPYPNNYNHGKTQTNCSLSQKYQYKNQKYSCFRSRTFQFYDMGRKTGATTTIKKSHSKKHQKPYGDANGGYIDDPEEAEDYAHRRI